MLIVVPNVINRCYATYSTAGETPASDRASDLRCKMRAHTMSPVRVACVSPVSLKHKKLVSFENAIYILHTGYPIQTLLEIKTRKNIYILDVDILRSTFYFSIIRSKCDFEFSSKEDAQTKFCACIILFSFLHNRFRSNCFYYVFFFFFCNIIPRLVEFLCVVGVNGNRLCAKSRMAGLERCSRLTRGNDPEDRNVHSRRELVCDRERSPGRYTKEAPKFPLATSALEKRGEWRIETSRRH